MIIAGEKDVIVIGAGSAGVAAAISAARTGADTLLIDRNGAPGGTSTVGAVVPFMTFHDPKGKAVIGGYIDEVINRMKKLGGSPGPLRCTGKPPWGVNPTVTPFEPGVLANCYVEMLREADVEVLLHTVCVDVVLQEDDVRGVVVENKSGRQVFLAKKVVDTSADADVAHLAGAPYKKGRDEDGLMQPMTLYFRLGNVDLTQVRDYIEKNQDDFRWWSIHAYEGQTPAGFEPQPTTFSGFRQLIAEAKAAGTLNLGRETLNGFAVLRPGEVVANTTRVNLVDGTNAWDLSQAELEAREQVLSFLPFARQYLPGFQDCYLVDVAESIGVRETRRIVGHYVLTQDDVISGRKFADVIARSGYPIDIHNPHDSKSTWIQLQDSYDIPYRCLVPQNINNLIVAGRCVSTTHEAYASVRVIPNCMAMGVAAGAAAALAVEQNVFFQDLDVQKLQKVLVEKMGANLGDAVSN